MKVYPRLKRLYHQLFHFRNNEIRQALRYLKGCRLVLDVGCGRGAFVRRAQAMGLIAVGVDWNHDSLCFAARDEASLVRANATWLPFADGVFDGVYCAHLIEHLVPEAAYGLLSEMARVLRVLGTLVLQAPLLHQGFFNDLTHVRPYAPEAILHYYSRFSRESSESTSPTRSAISAVFTVGALKYRYAPLYSPAVWPEHDLRRFWPQLALAAASFAAYRLGLHGLRRTGYSLVLKREE